MSVHVSCDHSRATAHFMGAAGAPFQSRLHYKPKPLPHMAVWTHDRHGFHSITEPTYTREYLDGAWPGVSNAPTSRKYSAFWRVKRGQATSSTSVLVVIVSRRWSNVSRNYSDHTRIVHCCCGACCTCRRKDQDAHVGARFGNHDFNIYILQ